MQAKEQQPRIKMPPGIPIIDFLSEMTKQLNSALYVPSQIIFKILEVLFGIQAQS